MISNKSERKLIEQILHTNIIVIRGTFITVKEKMNRAHNFQLARGP